MSYPNVWLHVLDRAGDLIRKPKEDGETQSYAAVATGAHDALFTNRYIRKYGIRTISKGDMAAHMSNGGVDYHRSSKELAARVLKHYGYDSYSDIDIYDRADIVVDLSQPVASEFHQKYDLVMDITSTYVTNIIQSYSNTSKMTKIGGSKIVITTLGDHTNRFDLNPSPNFLIDFHSNNGFVMERAFLINPKGTTIPYRRYATKSTPIFVLLPLWSLFVTLLRTLNTVRRIRPAIRKGDSIIYPARPGDKAIQATESTPQTEDNSAENTATFGLRKRVKYFLRSRLGEKSFSNIINMNRKFRYLRNAFFHDNLGHEWYIYCVFRKTEEVETPNIHITAHYQELNQTQPPVT